MSDFLLHERDGDVVTLTLNNPAERNALSTQAQWDEIVAACDKLRADGTVKAVILTGAGSAFSAGGNVKHMRERSGIARGTPYDIAQGYQGGIQRIPLALHSLEVPTIAAVNGAAIGAGCDLACMCDIRIASDRARFAESFVKLGIIPGDGGAWLLQRAIGYQRAAELSFTGDMIDAQQALAIGLVARVVPHDTLDAALTETIGWIRQTGPRARTALKHDLNRHLPPIDVPMFVESLASDEVREGFAAFVEKRPPRWVRG